MDVVGICCATKTKEKATLIVCINQPADSGMHHDQRVLVVADSVWSFPVGTDPLASAGIESTTCETIHQLCLQLSTGAGAILLTDHALSTVDIQELLRLVEDQPAWSDLPVILLQRESPPVAEDVQLLSRFRNLTVLDRSPSITSLISILRSAIGDRQRQYQLRDQLEEASRLLSQTRHLQRQLDSVIDAAEIGTIHVDLPSDRMSWNSRVKSHLGVSADAVASFDTLYSAIHPHDRERVRKSIDECLGAGTAYDLEFRSRLPANEVHWMRATGRAYRDSGNQPQSMEGTVQDITVARNNEEERQHLLDAERQAREEVVRIGRLKDEFLSNLSHELRTPLNVIFGWTQLLKLSLSDPVTLQEGISIIDRNVRLQIKLIEDLLDVNRIVSGKIRLEMQSIELPDIIEVAIEGARAAANMKEIRLTKCVATDVSSAQGDPARVQQILWNLLSNAIKFTQQGGEILISARRAERHWEISVTDNGCGIEVEYLPHLFERFTQADASISRKHGGLGLGLSIVKNLMELHGGTVTAESGGKGTGATFTIRFPIPSLQSPSEALETAPPITAERGESQHERLGTLAGIKVLVIEDEADARELMNRCLLTFQAQPTLAASAEEARHLLRSYHPDVIVSDIGMPGQNGFEFMRAERANGLQVPAVALTAYTRIEDRVRAIQSGFQMHLPKPVEPNELATVIAGLVGKDQHYPRQG